MPKRNPLNRPILNMDYASLYPNTMKLYDEKFFRREKIEHIMKKINDKRTNQELPS